MVNYWNDKGNNTTGTYFGYECVLWMCDHFYCTVLNSSDCMKSLFSFVAQCSLKIC